MAMHVASRHGGWISVFLRISNAACLNENCAVGPAFPGRIDMLKRLSVSELSYLGPVDGFCLRWGVFRFFFRETST